MPSRFATLAILLGVVVRCAPQLRAQETASDTLLTVNHYLEWERVSDPQISPDGSQIVYARSRVNQLEDRWDSELWLMNADGSKPRFLVKGSNARWSPDGARIAYLADGEPKGTQIFVRWMDAEGATSQVTRLTETPTGLRWSPDGRAIAFVMLVPEQETWSISMPAPPEGAKWTEPPRMISRTHYRQDRVGFQKEGFTHLFVVPADGGTARQLTRGTWNVGARFSGISFAGPDVSWTADGKTIVFDGVRDEANADRYAESYLYAVDVASGAVRQLVGEKGWWHTGVVSPDGRRVALLGYPFTTQTYRTEDLYIAAVDGRGMKKISGDLDRDPANLEWAPDGRSVYFTAGDRGSQNVYRADTTGRVQPVTSGVHMLTLASLAKNGVAACARSTFHEPPDVVRVDLTRGTVTPITHVNADVLSDKRLGAVEEIWYTSTGNTRVQGWIVKPPSFQPTEKYPLILDIHGGPHGMYNVGFDYGYQNYAANGYVVLYTNPRGSTGYGTAFGNAINNGYPGVDYEDLMAGVDSVVARGYIDTDRLYVTGCSGGGVLSSWTIGHTDRFAAAITDRCVADWAAMYYSSDFTLFTEAWFRKPPFEDPAEYAERSPVKFA